MLRSTRIVKDVTCRVAALLLPFVSLAGGCTDDSSSKPGPPIHIGGTPTGANTFDTSPIEVGAMPTDPAVASRIVYMPFGEAAARLGALTFEAHTHFIFSRGTEEVEQDTIASATQDADGNFAVNIDTGRSQFELYRIGEQVFVRQDKGVLRNKPRRDVATENFCDLAWSSSDEALELFQPYLRFDAGRAETVNGRAATRFELVLAAADAPPFVMSQPAVGRLAVAPPSRWRELMRPLSISGAVFVDNDSGVIVKSRLEGRIEIADRNIRPTQLSIRFEGAVSKVGAVATLAAPPSEPELVREPPPGDPIAFFRDEIEAVLGPAAAGRVPAAQPNGTATPPRPRPEGGDDDGPAAGPGRQAPTPAPTPPPATKPGAGK